MAIRTWTGAVSEQGVGVPGNWLNGIEPVHEVDSVVFAPNASNNMDFDTGGNPFRLLSLDDTNDNAVSCFIRPGVTIDGSALIHGGNNSGLIGGDVVFQPGVNYGTIDGNATFDGSGGICENHGTVGLLAIFTGDSVNFAEATVGSAQFNAGAANFGTVSGSAVFDGNSLHRGIVLGNANFVNGSFAVTATVNGTSTLDAASVQAFINAGFDSMGPIVLPSGGASIDRIEFTKI